jgi:exodeoxyribonuclease VII large subunit
MLEDRLRRTIARRIDQRHAVLAIERTVHGTMTRHMKRHRERLCSVERQLAAVDPHGVLRRGYSITAHADGRLIRSAGDVHAGDEVSTRLVDGQFASRVSGANMIEGVKTQRAAPRFAASHSRRNHPKPREQMDLF